MVIRNHPEHIEEALETVKALHMISANDFRDVAFTLHKESQTQVKEVSTKSQNINNIRQQNDQKITIFDYYLEVKQS